MDASMQKRINAMYRGDCVFAWIMLLGAWAGVWFVVFQMLPIIGIEENGLKALIVIASLVLCLFNTASILAMIKHYREDKEHIYGMDIEHLDANRPQSKS